MTSNGSQIQPGRLNERSNASSSGIQPRPSLPTFASINRATRSPDRPASARGRLQSWDAVRTDKIIRRRAEAIAKADARRRLLSQAFTLACCLVTITVAGVTLHREADLQRQAREMLR